MTSGDAAAPRCCPTCGEPMEVRDYGEVVLDACREHGFWFDTGEFETLRRTAAAAGQRRLQRRKRSEAKAGYREGYADGRKILSRAAVRSRRTLHRRRLRRARGGDPTPPEELAPVQHGLRPCPVCGISMEVETWKDLFKATPDVTVDLCEEHGLWLDHGELEALLERAKTDARRTAQSSMSRARWNAYEKGLRDGTS